MNRAIGSEYAFGSEISDSPYTTGITPLHLAAQRYDLAEIENLLQAGFSRDARNVIGETVAHALLSDEDRGRLNKDQMLECLKVLVDGDNVDVTDLKGETPLSLAVHNNFVECVRFLLSCGADTTVRTMRYPKIHSLATAIASKMPDIMMEIFDDAVTRDEKFPDKLIIKLDWLKVMQYSEKDVKAHEANLMKSSPWKLGGWGRDNLVSVETMFLYRLLYLPVSTRQLLLSHPLVAAFMHKKWEAVKRFRWIMKGTSLIFPAIYMFLTYAIYFHLCHLEFVDSTSTTPPDSEVVNTKEKYCELHLGVKVFAAFLITCLFGFFLSELRMTLLLINDYRFWTNWRSWVTRSGILLMGLTLWPASQIHIEVYKISWQFPLAAIGVFYAWVVILIHLDVFIPSVVVKVEMMVAIIINVLEITLLFTPLFIGFYMGFTLMFYDITNAMQFIMMVADLGSADYEKLIDDVMGEDGNIYRTWYMLVSFAFCVIFVLAIGIVFLNFLLGVTLDDIQKQMEVAETTILSNKVQILFVLDLNYPTKYNVAFEGNPPYKKLVCDLELPRDSLELTKEVRRGLVSILEKRQEAKKVDGQRIGNYSEEHSKVFEY